MRRSGHRQLTFGFADSPPGGGASGGWGVSPDRAALLLTAKGKTTTWFDTRTGGADRLLDWVASEQNLALALLNVVRNKGAPGVDGVTVEAAEANAPRLLSGLHRALLDGSYRPGPIRRVLIPKADGGKRPLGIPNVCDRVVQQALLQGLEQIFEPHFHASCHGYRPRRGARTAIAEVCEHLTAGHTVIVDLDLAKFFDRVCHQRLLARMGGRVSDGRVLDLVRRILRSKIVLEDGTLIANREGTSQGGPLSPLLSNIVLDEFDWELARRGHRFVRYADDCQVFVRSERAGRRVMASLTRYLESRLRLPVNAEKSAVRRPEEVHFLGFRFVRQACGGVEVHLSVKAGKQLAGKIREMTPRTWGRSLKSCIEAANLYLAGWIGHFSICTGEGVRVLRNADAHIRRRLRMIAVRQRKRPRFLVRHLVARGVKPKTAKRAAYACRGLWPRSNHSGVTTAYPNAWFHQRLVSLLQRWQDLNTVVRVSEQLRLEL